MKALGKWLVASVVALPLVGAAVVVGFFATYSTALKGGRNSFLMILLGRRYTGFLLSFIQDFVSGNEKARQSINKRMIGEAKEKSRMLDKLNMDPGGVCFTGSSTFTFWINLERDMKPVSGVYNAAFGGACTQHVLAVAEDLVINRKPSVIVYYCGTNDLAYRESNAEKVANGFVKFVEQVLKTSPKTKIAYLSIIPTPLHASHGEKRLELIDKVNNLVKDFAGENWHNVAFVDCSHCEFVKDEKMYLYDGQHFTKEGHRNLAKVLQPVIQELASTN